MATKTYNKIVDCEKLAEAIEQWFAFDKFETQLQSSDDYYMVQAKKSSKLRSALGGSRAFTVVIKSNSKETIIETTTGQWVQNLSAVGIGTLLTGGLSLVGSGMAASWTKKIEVDLWNFLDNEVLSHVRSNTERECPYCAETIKAKAKICRYCDREVEPLVEEFGEILSSGDVYNENADNGKPFNTIGDSAQRIAATAAGASVRDEKTKDLMAKAPRHKDEWLE